MTIARISVFAIALIVGVGAVYLVQDYPTSLKEELVDVQNFKSSVPVSISRELDTAKPPTAKSTPDMIVAKPRAEFTDAARTAGVTGVVRLNVTLRANGTIGSITPIKRLPHGLTEKALEAARKIKFEPRRVNGVPQTIVRTVEYNFSIY